LVSTQICVRCCCAQVFGVARQVLSLVAGGAIDEWLLGLLRGLRQEHCCARALHALQQQLWPGGAWFQSLPENQHPVRARTCPHARAHARMHRRTPACMHAASCMHATSRCTPCHLKSMHAACSVWHCSCHHLV
jgi:hypothetical protein